NNELKGGKIGSNQEICYNTKPAAFTSTTAGSGGRGTAVYSWEYSTNGTNWTTIGSSNSSGYTYNVALTQTTKFRRKFNNTCTPAVYSDTITVTVNNELKGGKIGSNQEICYNTKPAAFTSTTAGSGGRGTAVYSWEYSTNGTNWTTIGSSNSAAYTYNVALTQTTKFRRKFNNTCTPAVYSDTITVTVNNELKGGKIGSNQEICYNTKPAAFTSTAPASGGNTAGYTYYWQYSIDNGVSWIYIDNSNTLDYTPTAALTQTTQYRRMVTNTCGTDSTSPATVTVRSAALYNYPDIRVRVCPDEDVEVNLSKYIDTLDLLSVVWESLSGVPINSTTGVIPANKLVASRVYTFTYTASNPCASDVKRKLYLETLNNGKMRPLKDVVVMCYEHAEAVNINQLFGIDAGNGSWTYQSFTAGDVDNYVTKSPVTSLYSGAVVMDGVAIFNNIAAKPYHGVAEARQVTFTYTPAINSCLAGKSFTMTVVLTPNILN
ncbi:MAG: hypothetical protein LBS43_09335, partial [Prevotellaceae bacterium]|nr:hypothetical protein [Prevotellaceae bacterium]